MYWLKSSLFTIRVSLCWHTAGIVLAAWCPPEPRPMACGSWVPHGLLPDYAVRAEGGKAPLPASTWVQGAEARLPRGEEGRR